jgi:hypothetical protein
MCETPLSQCVTKKAVDAMLYADYTIYEITGAYKVRNYKDEMKTIYNLHCYSVDQWINGRAGVIISAMGLRESRETPVEGWYLQYIKQHILTNISQAIVFLFAIICYSSMIIAVLMGSVVPLINMSSVSNLLL